MTAASKAETARRKPPFFFRAALMVSIAALIVAHRGGFDAGLVFGSAAAQDRPGDAAGQLGLATPQSIELGDLIEALKKNQEGLKEEQRKLETEKQGLEALKRDIEAKFTRLSKAQEELRSLMAQIKKIETGNVERLVKIYDGMKPEEAAPLVSKLDRKWAILLMQNMKQSKTSKIMALLEPGLAAAMSEQLLGPPWLRRTIVADKQIELWKIYEDMKPEEAATLLEKFDDGALVQLLSRMKRRSVSKILPLMGDERAVRISQLLDKKKSDKDDELWKIYEDMKPEEAATLLEKFDDGALVQLLSRMKRRSVSKILPLMGDERAVKISQLLAQKETDKDKPTRSKKID